MRSVGGLKDIDIRTKLLSLMQREHADVNDCLVVEELGLCQGTARIDVAVINGSIHGFEIKSEKDDLDRLPGQIEVYAKSLDAVTVVTTQRHLPKVEQSVPPWWGILLAVEDGNDVAINEYRQSGENPSIDPAALVQLLWKEEALLLLQEKGLARGMTSKSREIIWRRLVESTSAEELRSVVRERLKSRRYWRAGTQQE